MISTTAVTSPSTHTYPRQGSSLYYALSLVPSDQRRSLAAWLAWWHDTARIPLDIADPGVAETKLRWWQQALAEAAQGQAQHPLLQQLMAPDALHPPAQLPPWSCLLVQLDGLIALINQNRWLDDSALQGHIHTTTGLACEGAAWLLGAHSEAACEAARQLGCGLRQAHQLARLGLDARAGWVHVPIDVLQQHGVRAHQLSKPEAGQPPEGWDALLATLSRQATGSLQQGLVAWRALPATHRQALKPLSALAHMHLSLVKQIASEGDAVLHQRIVLTPLRKWWICQKVRWGLLT